MGEPINAYRLSVGTPERKARLGRPRCGLEDNGKIGLKETARKGAD
jgi:hypothetical protein